MQSRGIGSMDGIYLMMTKTVRIVCKKDPPRGESFSFGCVAQTHRATNAKPAYDRGGQACLSGSGIAGKR